jgi:hypothetical protein
LADAVESGETRDVRCGTEDLTAEELVAEDNLPDVEADKVPDFAEGALGFGGASDVLRVGVGMEGVVVDGLGGMVAFEDGAEVDTGDFFKGGFDEGVGLRVEET